MDNELNAYLQPSNSPVTSAGAVTGYQFFTGYSRNAITQGKIPFLPVSKIGAGTIIVSFNLGSNGGAGYILLDGGNNRILVNDGTTNRIVIGSV